MKKEQLESLRQRMMQHGDEYGKAVVTLTAAELSALLFAAEKEPCPCLHTTPCHARCTCLNGGSSFGCRRCCTYGSPEQQKAMAKYLARVIDAARAGVT